jgi:hypothetical protein
MNHSSRPVGIEWFLVAAALLLAGLSLVALGSAMRDAAATGQVFLPRLSRHGVSAFVPWQQALVYLLAHCAWVGAGMLTIAACFRGTAWARRALSSFVLGALLFLLSYWSLSVAVAVFAVVALAASTLVQNKPRWFVPACVLVVAVAVVCAIV